MNTRLNILYEGIRKKEMWIGVVKCKGKDVYTGVYPFMTPNEANQDALKAKQALMLKDPTMDYETEIKQYEIKK